MKTGRVIFGWQRVVQVDVPETTAEQQQGFRDHAEPTARGMLFDFGRQQPTMTMSGVAFPLDMLFIAEDGDVVHAIQAEAVTPGPFASPVQARWVLEMRAGRWQALGFPKRAAIIVDGRRTL